MLCLFLFFIFLQFFPQLKSPSPSPRKIKPIVEKNPELLGMANDYNTSAIKQLLGNDPGGAAQSFIEAAKVYVKLRMFEKAARLYIEAGNARFLNKQPIIAAFNYNVASYYFDKSYLYLQAKESMNKEAFAYVEAGVSAKINNDLSGATVYFSFAAEIFIKIGDQDNARLSYLRICSFYGSMARKAIEDKNFHDAALAYHEAATNAIKADKIEHAIKNYTISIQAYGLCGKYEQAKALQQKIADLLCKRTSSNLSQIDLMQCLQLSDESDSVDLAISLALPGFWKQSADQYLLKKEFFLAANYYDKAYQEYKSIEKLELAKVCYDKVTQNYIFALKNFLLNQDYFSVGKCLILIIQRFNESGNINSAIEFSSLALAFDGKLDDFNQITFAQKQVLEFCKYNKNPEVLSFDKELCKERADNYCFCGDIELKKQNFFIAAVCFRIAGWLYEICQNADCATRLYGLAGKAYELAAEESYVFKEILEAKLYFKHSIILYAKAGCFDSVKKNYAKLSKI